MVSDVIFQFNRYNLLTLTALINVSDHYLAASFMTPVAKLPCPTEQLLRSEVGRYNPVVEN